MIRRIFCCVILFVFVAIVLLLAHPAWHLWQTWRHDPSVLPATVASGQLDDASRLDATRVARIIHVPSDPHAAETQLVELVRRAGRDHLRISIAGAQHSMGGHSLYPGGIVLDMLPFNHLSLDTAHAILTVGAGARWSEVIPYLDRRGFSVAVMQSNNDFTVGGSLSVNCHGWQQNSPPIAGTVRSLRLLTADGTIVRCSRGENPRLFRLALGGYGLFGVILDAELRVVPNEYYRPASRLIPARDYFQVYRELTSSHPDVGMAYGRISVAPASFLSEAIITVFRRQPGAGSAPVNTLRDEKPSLLKRLIFRGSVGSDYGKNLCWRLEKWFGGENGHGLIARNQIMNEPASWYENRDPAATDILHEYFIPGRNLAAFLDRIRPILRQHHPDLLNITVRDVERDHDSLLAYAREEVFGLVMYFHEARTPAANAAMRAFTRDMIDAALACGGTYYLPYRLDATRAQFLRAYPPAPEFFALKRACDPEGIFQNEFYLAYGRPAPAAR